MPIRTPGHLMVLVSAMLITLACSSDLPGPSMPLGPRSGSGPVAAVKVAPLSAELSNGGVLLAETWLRDSRGQTLSDRVVSWSSSNTSIATVSSRGEVTAVGTGSVNIVATSEGLSDTLHLTVSEPLASEADENTIVISPRRATVLEGTAVKLRATLNGKQLPANRSVVWQSSAPGIASAASNGRVSGHSAGDAVITVVSGSNSGDGVIEVVPASPPPTTEPPQEEPPPQEPPQEEPPPQEPPQQEPPPQQPEEPKAPVPTTLTLSPATASLLVGGTQQLSASVLDQNGQPIGGASVTWTSSATGVATVNASGLVSAVGAGSATVTASSSGLSKSATISVTAPPTATTLNVSPSSLSLLVGATGQLSATVLDQHGKTMSGVTVSWSSSKASVATVNASGLVTAVSAGSATITASSSGLTKSVNVSVTAPPTPTSITIAPSSLSLLVGATGQLTATVKDQSGNTMSGVAVTWSSSQAGVATVNSSGLVSGKAAGSATITASASGLSSSASVTVTQQQLLSGVVINVGDNIQNAVNANPTGTQFVIKAGVHRGQSVRPKSGNKFIGEPGAVLDGNGTVEYAFHKGSAPYPSNVHIENLTIQNYRPPVQMGAINIGGHTPAESADRWTVQKVVVRNNLRGGGIRIGHRSRILNNTVIYNSQIGIMGIGDSTIVEGNEIAYNNHLREWDPGWEAGGTKFVMTHDLILRNNYVHHNVGPGLWSDIDNLRVLYENNRVEDNEGMGIFHEISYDAIIRNNQVRRNGFKHCAWLYGAGILISNSQNIQVYGNVLENNCNGITAVEQNRGSGRYGPYIVQNVHVYNNSVRMQSGLMGMAQDIGNTAIFTSRNNRFSSNTYYLSHARPFAWSNGTRTDSEWRGFGHDTQGTFNR